MSIDERYDEFRRGVAEFNRREFFECHDTWEHLWQETTGADKLFLQGLIHAAVGLYHFSNGQWKGARSQLEKCVAKLSGYRPTYRGIDVAALCGALEREFFPAIDAALNGNAIAPPTFPTLEMKSQPNGDAARLLAQLDQQRVSFQNEIAALTRERDDAREKLKSEQEKFSLTLKRHLKNAEKKERALYAIIASLAVALVAALVWR